MGKKIFALASIVAVVAAVLVLFGGKLNNDAFAVTGFAVRGGSADTSSPADRITEDIIRTSEETVLIKIANATIGRLEGTNSMSPVLGSNSSTIMVQPERAEDVKEGDIIAYSSEEASGFVVHRVVKVGKDENGWFAETKGDNAVADDPVKVRFEQVRYVIVGILY